MNRGASRLRDLLLQRGPAFEAAVAQECEEVPRGSVDPLSREDAPVRPQEPVWWVSADGGEDTVG